MNPPSENPAPASYARDAARGARWVWCLGLLAIAMLAGLLGLEIIWPLYENHRPAQNLIFGGVASVMVLSGVMSLLLGITLLAVGAVQRRGWKPARRLAVSLLPALTWFATAITLPLVGISSERSPATITLSNAKQVVLSCRIYASDHEGNFPKNLEELVPQYLSERQLLSNPKGKNNDTQGMSFDYFGSGLKDTDPPNRVILRSRELFAGKRVEAHVDATAVLVRD
jgi:hypothetical protein